MAMQFYPGSPEGYAAAKPNATVFFENGVEMSWKAYNDAADRIAQALERLGVSSGERIGVMMSIRHEWFVVQLAASKLGVSLVGINNRATLSEAEYIISDSKVAALVLDVEAPDDMLRIAKQAGITPFLSFHASPMLESPTYAEIMAASDAPAARASIAPAPLILYTSGTTGRPKGVALDPALLATRANVLEYRKAMAEIIPVDERSRFLLSLPLHHGAGPGSALFCLRAGGSVVFQPHFEAEEALRLISTYKITSWMAVPTMVHRLRALPERVRAKFDRSSMQTINIGAAAVPMEIKAWALEYFGAQCLVFEGYGMSETQMISYMLPRDWPIAPNSSGKPMPFVEVKIIDIEGNALGVGQQGEICAKTPLMIDRYLNRPPLGPEDITHDGFMRTGDIGYLDEAGYLYVTDRLKDMVIVGGANVYPAEVEAALQTHPAILEAAVIGIPDPDMGEAVLAICELKPGLSAAPEELTAHCKQTLASYKAPKHFRFVNELPRNATGKVTKQTLRQAYRVQDRAP